jgi:hypothetical protein
MPYANSVWVSHVNECLYIMGQTCREGEKEYAHRSPHGRSLTRRSAQRAKTTLRPGPDQPLLDTPFHPCIADCYSGVRIRHSATPQEKKERKKKSLDSTCSATCEGIQCRTHPPGNEEEWAVEGAVGASLARRRASRRCDWHRRVLLLRITSTEYCC